MQVENVTLGEMDAPLVIEGRPGRFVRLSITDTGTGMDEETREHIFEPFFTTKDKDKGSGLGLSIAYGILRQSQGWINVYSDPGQGSTFRLYLPVISGSSEDENERSGGATSEAEMRGNGERILLVEDDKSIRAATQKLLSANGYFITSAESAEEALAIFDSEDGGFQLVLSDVVLPGKSGVELVDHLLAQKPELRIILSSGYAGDKSQLLYIREKGYPFMQKPYSSQTLLCCIKENLAQAGDKSTNQSNS